MITLEDIEKLLRERRKELEVLRKRHEVIVKRLQNELNASCYAFQQVSGAIIELEALKLMAGQEGANGEVLKDPRTRETEHEHV
jgi:hypothetical protein